MKKSDTSAKSKRLYNKERKKCKEKENTKQLDKRRNSISANKIEKSFEEMDLSSEIYPIAHYVNNKEEMVNQLFNICKGEDLKILLPACLKNHSISDLKQVCLEQLQLMSDKRILNVLQGKTALQSRATDVDQPDQIVGQSVSTDPSYKTVEGGREKVKRPLSDYGDSQQADSTSIDLPDIPLKRKLIETYPASIIDKDSTLDSDITTVDLDLCPNDDEVDSLMKEPVTIETIKQKPQEGGEYVEEMPSSQTPVSSTTVTVEMGEKEWMTAFTKTQLEILELELRARAIRSLMKAQGLHSSDNEDTQKFDDRML